MSPRLFATDLDGTLLGANGELSATTIEMLGRVVARGARVVAITGRSPRTALERLQPHGVIEAALCNNGAVRLDVTTGTITSALALDADGVADLVGQLAAVGPGIGLAWETEDGFVQDHAFATTGLLTIGSPRTLGNSEPLPRSPLKMLVAHTEIDPYRLTELLEQHIDTEFSLATSGAPFIEITATHKGAALAAYCAEHDIERADVVAYGDNNNDVSMLEWAGVGVAVANAKPLAHEVADATIGHHVEHSVALDMARRLALI